MPVFQGGGDHRIPYDRPAGNLVVADGTPVLSAGQGYQRCCGDVRDCSHEQNGGSSEDIPVLEALPVLAGCGHHLPDMIGYGKYGNTKEMYHPFMMIDNLGKTAWDMRQAAIEFLPGWVTGPKTGYLPAHSAGGGVGLAVARYYQEHHLWKCLWIG